MWMRVDDTMPDHPKVRRLIRLLRVEDATGIGHLVSLWLWVLRYRPDGDITGLDDDELAYAARWKGDARTFVRSMQEAGLFDEDSRGVVTIHDWLDYAGSLREAERKAKQRQRKAASSDREDVPEASRPRPATVPGQSRDSRGTVPADRTGQDETGPDTTDPLSKTRGEDRARGSGNRRSTDVQPPFNERSPSEMPPTPVPLPASPAGPLARPAPEPPPPTSAQAIAPPGPVQGPSAPVGAPPSPEEILGAWSEAGLPPAQRHEVELLLDRAIRLRPGRDLAWCRTFFARIAASPWCRGEVHSHPGSREWTLDYALGSERRISEVMAGRYDDRPATKAGPRGGEGGRPGKRFSIFDAPQEDAVLFSIDRTRKAKASAPRAEKRDGDGEWVEAPERKRLGSGGERR